MQWATTPVTQLASSRPFGLTVAPRRTAIALAILVHLAVFAALIVVPVRNEIGELTSPLTLQTTTDISFYQNGARAYFGPGTPVVDDLLSFFSGEADLETPTYPPPLFPALLHLSDYGPGNTLPLALVYLALGIATAWIWLIWLDRNGLCLPFLVVYACLPNLLWFSISITSDLPFSFLLAAFFVSYFVERRSTLQEVTWMVCLGAMVLTRTNSLSLLLFVALDLLLFSDRLGSRNFAKLLVIVLMIGIFGIFYLPSFNGTFLTMERITFFGVKSSEFLDGVYPQLPNSLNLALSWLSLLAAKTLYMLGLRPSFSDVSLIMVLARSAAGIFLLPGLIYLFLYANWRYRLFMFLFVLPILMGPAQDRYILPVQAILFFYGVRSYAAVFGWAKSWLAARLRIPAKPN